MAMGHGRMTHGARVPSHVELSEEQIKRFLYFGFLPEVKEGVLSGAWAMDKTARRASFAQCSLAQLVREGRRALGSGFSNAGRGDHVVPVSGGLDSRITLAFLLKQVGPSAIRALTFGTPGTLDFELGRQVARTAGVRWEGIDLTRVRFETDRLVAYTGSRTHWWPVLHGYLHEQLREQLKPHSIVWSGYMGGPMAGGRCVLPQPNESWEGACRHFLGAERYATSTQLLPDSFNLRAVLPAEPFLDRRSMNYEEQLNLMFNEECRVKPAVVLDACDFRTPYVSPDWVEFMLSVPHRYRLGKILYKEILRTTSPALFALPIKQHLGLPIDAPHWRIKLYRHLAWAAKVPRRVLPGWPWGIDQKMNYVDFERGIRQRGDLRTVVYENIQDLKRRGVVEWIDIDGIWRRHQHRLADHSDALTLLTSLELILKAAERGGIQSSHEQNAVVDTRAVQHIGQTR